MAESSPPPKINSQNGENDWEGPQKSIEMADELNKMQIEQLHRATVNFSNSCMETKKLCVTVEVAAFTLLAGLYNNWLKSGSVDELILTLQLVGVLISFLFYIVDVVFYFYQDRLRESMFWEENEIRKRHGLEERAVKHGSRLLRSFFNGSHILYAGLALIAFTAPYIYQFFIN